MEKIFYLVDVSATKENKVTVLVNSPYSLKHLLMENDFWDYLRDKDQWYKFLGKQYVLFSVLEDEKDDFVSSCKEVGIVAKEVDLKKLYAAFSKEHSPYVPSKQQDIPEENMLNVCEQDVCEIICGPGTKQILLEHKIAGKDNINIYINSKENAQHNIPHCHIKYNGESNYCVLSLIDFEKLAPDGNLRNAVVRKAQELLKQHIQEARKKWNEIDSTTKFAVLNGEYTSELVFK